GHLDLGDQVADGRIRPRKVDPGLLADQAATAVTSDEVVRPQRTAVGEGDVDAGVVVGKAGHLAPAQDRDPQLLDPGGEDTLDGVLPEREPVAVARGKVADVERGAPEARDLRGPALREEAIRDATLIEHLDRARVQAARARAGELLVDAPLDDRDV